MGTVGLIKHFAFCKNHRRNWLWYLWSADVWIWKWGACC